LSITIHNIYPVKGDIYIAIYDNDDDFMDIEKVAFRKIAPIESEVQTIILNDIPAGEYAVSVFQDIDENGELIQILLAYPANPSAFRTMPGEDSVLPNLKMLSLPSPAHRK